MAMETLGEAFSLGWRVTAKCGQGKHLGMKQIRECQKRYELDMETLVWTRGPNFPLRAYKKNCSFVPFTKVWL